MRPRRWIVGMGLACSVALSSMPPAHAAPKAALRPGMVYREAGLSVVVPPAGMTVWAEAMRPSGTSVVIGVQTRADGTTVVHRAAMDRAGADGADAAQAVLDPCADQAHLTAGTAWASAYRWRFKASTTPVGMSKTAVTAALKRAVANITGADNDCDEADQVGAEHTYLGGTTKAANVGTGSTCTAYDSVSVVSFGDLAGTDLAMTCWWTLSGETIEADVKLNKIEFAWVVNPGTACVSKFAVEAVATHEFGHVFGLDHVSEAQHGALTMSPVISPCQKSEVSLGLGDLIGLEDLY